MYISVITPTLNEEAHIEKAILSANAADEIIVVDGGSCDATIQIAERLGARVTKSQRGRGVQQDVGAENAAGDVFLFLHADTNLPDGWIQSMRGVLTDDSTVGGAFLLGIDSSKPMLKFINLVSNLRARYLGLIYGDQAIFVRRKVFFKMNGFKGLPIMEDVDFIRRLKKYGRIRLLSKKVLTSCRRWEKGGIIKTTIKNWLFLLLYYSWVSPQRIYKWYYCDKVRSQEPGARSQ